MEAVVSRVFVLNQIKEVLQFRETWLEQQGLPMDFQMRDKLERWDFLQWAKELYRAEEHQQKLYREQLEKKGKKIAMKGQNSRWNRELQRRLGAPALWHMVSFTGRFDPSFLKSCDDSTQTVVHKREPTKDLTRIAVRARDCLRRAESLARNEAKGIKILTDFERRLVADLREGTLHAAANAATRKSGFGRIKHPNGDFEDIAPHNGGIVRTVLDKIVTTTADDDSQDEEDLS